MLKAVKFHPLVLTYHRVRSVGAVIDLAAVLAQPAPFNHRRSDEEIPPVEIRVGLHHGPVVVGMIGSDGRTDYAAMDSAVNLAARIQTACQPGGILIPGERVDYLPEGTARPAGKYELKEID